MLAEDRVRQNSVRIAAKCYLTVGFECVVPGARWKCKPHMDRLHRVGATVSALRDHDCATRSWSECGGMSDAETGGRCSVRSTGAGARMFALAGEDISAAAHTRPSG